MTIDTLHSSQVHVSIRVAYSGKLETISLENDLLVNEVVITVYKSSAKKAHHTEYRLTHSSSQYPLMLIKIYPIGWKNAGSVSVFYCDQISGISPRGSQTKLFVTE